jgi:carbamoyl-phosphate synthase small subunit
MGCVTTELSTGEALSKIREIPRYDDLDLVKTVSTGNLYQWGGEFNSSMGSGNIHILVSDCGLKFNILRCLLKRGCSVTVVPAQTSASEILGLEPDGVIFSPGPGDPVHQGLSVSILRELMGRIPIMGICLGHQLLAKACGAKTFKLKFGHRGGNHPVRDITTGRVHITAQNHGYAVDTDSLPAGLEASHVSLNDGTLEGVVHTEYPMMGIQFHSEASPGPLDNGYLFDRFLSMVKEVV